MFNKSQEVFDRRTVMIQQRERSFRKRLLFILFIVSLLQLLRNTELFCSQGRPGDKGQKGELGSPGFDVLSAVKVSKLRYLARSKAISAGALVTRKCVPRVLSFLALQPPSPFFREQSRKAPCVPGGVWYCQRAAPG